MIKSPVEKLEDIIRKTSFWGKSDDYSPSIIYPRLKEDTTRFESSLRLHEIICELLSKGIISESDLSFSIDSIIQIDPSDNEFLDIINQIYDSVFKF